MDAALRTVSDTALITAAQRTRESRRGRPLFDDPYADLLAGPRGRALARHLTSRLVASGVVARTTVFDQWITRTIRDGRVGCVLSLGAGLDTRPYRLDLPATLQWVEADLPGVLDHKANLLGDSRPRCRLQRWPIDLSDSTSRRQVLDRIATDQPVLVVTEGVVPYLTDTDVTGLAVDLAARPAFQWWAVDIIAPIARRLADRVAGRRLASADAQFRFAPDNGPDFFSELGWRTVDIQSSWFAQRRLHREPLGMRAIWKVSTPRLREVLKNMGQFLLLHRT
jgi:methyltransferase (TIGR00027 family)